MLQGVVRIPANYAVASRENRPCCSGGLCSIATLQEVIEALAQRAFPLLRQALKTWTTVATTLVVLSCTPSYAEIAVFARFSTYVSTVTLSMVQIPVT